MTTGKKVLKYLIQMDGVSLGTYNIKLSDLIIKHGPCIIKYRDLIIKHGTYVIKHETYVIKHRKLCNKTEGPNYKTWDLCYKT